MFRKLLRSAPDPTFREHVCFSCLAGVRAQARLFSSTPLSQTDSPEVQETSQRKNRPDQASRTTSKPRDSTPSNRGARNTLKPRGKPPSTRRIKTRTGTSIEDTFQTLAESLNSYSQSPPPDRPPKQSTQKKPIERAKPEKPPAQTPVVLKSALNQLVSELDGSGGFGEAYTFPQPPLQVRKAIVSRPRRHFASAKKPKCHLQEVHAEEQPPVPNLSYGLDRVLFNPGVYQLRDPRTRVHNFDPYLGSIMPVTEFDFAALKDYVTSSSDNTLRDLAIKHKRKYIGSTSSMTSVLSHFHYLLSSWRPLNTSAVSRGFSDTAENFSLMSRAPAAIFLRYRDGVYAIDADKEFDGTNILLNLGKSLEKLLTVPKEHFERYRRSHENKITAAEEQLTRESYNYSMLGDFMMRSQLDAYDPRLPGTGMFDLKTRAVVSIRQHSNAIEDGLGYQIKSRFGDFESYEREYYDMIRSAFLKYSLQVRIGRMDGIFVAFHNIAQIFGFQYVCLPEMDQALHGQWNTALGDQEFRLSIQLWNKVLDKATAKYPNRSLRFHFETRPTNTPYMYIFYEPVTEEEIEAIQNTNKAEIDAMQRKILNMEPEDESDSTITESDDQASEVLASSEEASVEPLSEEEQESRDSLNTTSDADADAPKTQTREVGAMTLTISNRVNGQPVPRPENFTDKDQWVVEFEMSDLEGPEVAKWYKGCQSRRRVAHQGTGRDWRASSSFHRRLKDLAKRGRELRKTQEKLDRKLGKLVLDGVKV
ncbi:mitochondrial protein Pet127-domain-containing protein [Aspergillus heterothallicus]